MTRAAPEQAMMAPVHGPLSSPPQQPAAVVALGRGDGGADVSAVHGEPTLVPRRNLFTAGGVNSRRPPAWRALPCLS